MSSNQHHWLGEFNRLDRKNAKRAWNDWSQVFCGGGTGRWDRLECIHAIGRGAISKYERQSGGAICCGAPDLGLFWEGDCNPLPLYQQFQELYGELGGDALYIWDLGLSWTLIVHHEQFGGLVAGPIWGEPV